MKKEMSQITDSLEVHKNTMSPKIQHLHWKAKHPTVAIFIEIFLCLQFSNIHIFRSRSPMLTKTTIHWLFCIRNIKINFIILLLLSILSGDRTLTVDLVVLALSKSAKKKAICIKKVTEWHPYPRSPFTPTT